MYAQVGNFFYILNVKLALSFIWYHRFMVRPGGSIDPLIPHQVINVFFSLLNKRSGTTPGFKRVYLALLHCFSPGDDHILNEIMHGTDRRISYVSPGLALRTYQLSESGRTYFNSQMFTQCQVQLLELDVNRAIKARNL